MGALPARIHRASAVVATVWLLVAMLAATTSITPASAAPPLNDSVRKVRIRAVLTADDDGGHAATITPAQVKTMVDAANAIWAGSGVLFLFDAATDVDHVNSTAMNNDCVPVFDGTWWCDKGPTAAARWANAYAPANQHRVTVWFRYGSSELVCEGFNCENKQATGGSSSHRAPSVSMPNYFPGNRLLAHELGHYFWLPHTFAGGNPPTLAAARQLIKDYVESSGKPKAQGLDVFDGDRGWGVTDTAPDPRGTLWEALKGDDCANDAGDDTHPVTVTFSDASTFTYTLAPPRNNVMSYFGCAAIPQTLSPDQRKHARASIDAKNRDAQVGNTPNWVNPEEFGADPLPGGPFAAVVPFTQGHRAHLLAYRADGSFQIKRLADDPRDGLSDIGTGGTLAAGFTTFMPYTLNGQPHLLAYNAATGKVNFLRVKPSGLDVEVVWSWTWATGWSTFMPFTQNGQPHFIAYNKTTGEVHFDRINASGQGIQILWSWTWAAGWSSFLPYVINGNPHFIAYNKTTGEVHFDRINAGPQGIDILATHTWGTGWTNIVPFDRGAQQRYVIYNKATGQTHVDRITADGKSWVTMFDGSLGAGRETLVSLRHMGQWLAHAYDAGNGAATLRYLHQ